MRPGPSSHPPSPWGLSDVVGWVVGTRARPAGPVPCDFFCTCFSSDISWGTVALFTSCLTALVLPRLSLLSGLKSTAEIAHAMRDAREGHSVTYLQLKEVPAGIHVRRQGARLGATGTGKSLSPGCELRPDWTALRLGSAS